MKQRYRKTYTNVTIFPFLTVHERSPTVFDLDFEWDLKGLIYRVKITRRRLEIE